MLLGYGYCVVLVGWLPYWVVGLLNQVLSGVTNIKHMFIYQGGRTMFRIILSSAEKELCDSLLLSAEML